MNKLWTAAAILIAGAAGLSAVGAMGQPAPADPDLLQRIEAADPALGERIGVACLGCHTIDPGVPAATGPNLYDIVGAPIARDPAFAYSPAMAALGATGGTWTYEFLDTFLTSPFVAVLGTRMGFSGLPDANERAAVIAWLRLQSAEPVPIDVVEADPTRPVYQAYQADSGRLYYGNECASCHGPTGGGGPGVPPLKGPEFEANWNGRTVWDLFNFVRRTQPPGAAGGIEDQMLARILAYVLQINGYEAGPDPFRVDRASLEQLIFRFPL